MPAHALTVEARGQVLREADLQAETPLLGAAFRTASAWSASKIHRRADCPAYKKILEANGGQRPVRHMRDFEKARKAFQDKLRKPRSKFPARGNEKGGSRKRMSRAWSMRTTKTQAM